MALLDTAIPSVNPPDSEAWKFGAQRIRELKDSLQSILGIIFSSTTTFQPGGIRGAAIEAASLTRAQQVAEARLPTGMTTAYAGATAPTGWLFCDGSAVSRVTYADLLSAIGTAWGVGDGVTTFNVPDLRGRTPFGLDNMGTAGAASRLTADGSVATRNHVATLGASGGFENHTLITNELAKHGHNITSDATTGVTIGGAPGGQNVASGAIAALPAAATFKANGGDASHNNMPPYVAVNYIIKT